jgi:hypothetical protein
MTREDEERDLWIAKITDALRSIRASGQRRAEDASSHERAAAARPAGPGGHARR